ncbi:hypothetical protein I6N95_25070 [Vagococcus sp. BWB3-3]|uniref:Uncharacterized protein n=1 Tax=Vagococcus allomyrinae TaxID=2794353 RepID=A0A940P9L0_9ENTE|nr:hypothetical protein [Vagococcus allomyrinae]MBP1044284.1 hypothetical protein [Vagococcus allomyrinae]
MNLGKETKVIQPTATNYVIQLVVGCFGILLLFVPVTREILENYAYSGINARYLILFLGILAIIHGIFKIINIKQEPCITLYEAGLKVGTFSSTYEDLIIRVTGNKFSFSNRDKEVSYILSLSKKDYKTVVGI